MNKLKTNIDGKFPFVLDDIRFLDDTYRKSINAILLGLMRFKGIVYGCKLVINGNQATIQEGAIWLNEELLPVPEQTFNYDPSHNYYFKLNSYFAPEGNRTFGNGTTHDTYEIRIAEVHDGGGSTSLPDMIKIGSSKLVDNAPGRLARISTGQGAPNGLLPNSVVGTSSSGALVSCSVKSAFNKDFGFGTENIPEIGLELESEKIIETNSNKKLISVNKNSAYNKDFGFGTENIPEIGLELESEKIIETNSNKKLISVNKNSAYNRNFGQNTNEVEKGSNNPDGLITVKMELGAWDMTSDVGSPKKFSFPAGISVSAIINLSVFIRNDDGYLYNGFTKTSTESIYFQKNLAYAQNGLFLTIYSGSAFNSSVYSNSSINRGYAIITLLG